MQEQRAGLISCQHYVAAFLILYSDAEPVCVWIGSDQNVGSIFFS